MHLLRLAFVMLLLAVSGTGCARFSSWFERDDGETEPLDQTLVQPISRAEHEETIRRLVRREVEQALRSKDEDQNTVVREQPYFYRAYTDYPNGADDPDVLVVETDSRTAPYQGRVTVDAVQFATRLTRSRTEAASDTDFIRSTGNETFHFEYRSNEWRKVGSTFVADRSEERVDGEWVAVNEERERMIEPEDRPGLFRRTFNALVGN